MTAAALHSSAALVRSGEFLFAENQIASVGDCKHTQPPLCLSCRCHQGQKPPVNTHHTWIYLSKPYIFTWCERVFYREQWWARLEWFWGVYIVWDSISNLVPVSDKLEATTWRTTYPATVRFVRSIRYYTRNLTGLRFVTAVIWSRTARKRHNDGDAQNTDQTTQLHCGYWQVVPWYLMVISW